MHSKMRLPPTPHDWKERTVLKSTTSNGAEMSVRVEGLRKVFDVHKRSGLFRRTISHVNAVNDISFNVPSGQAVAFIGPNGAGKSTTIKMLTGILTPTAGHATVLGYVPWEQRTKLTYHIGAVFGQRSQLWYHLPPGDTFELLARVYEIEPETYRKRRDMLIDRFHLGAFLDTPVRKLSLGQRMRAEVAASLLHAPKVIFLDEPTIGLDVIARQELRDLIREWNQNEGLTVFLTSHDAGDIERVVRRVIVVNNGNIVFDDKVSAMRRRYLASKVLSVKFATPPAPFSLHGVEVLKASDYALKLQVDTGVVGIEAVMHHVLQTGQVADIAIEDPALEDVIAHIYGQTNNQIKNAADTMGEHESERAV
jgi:ABC-2 type transport system ATP-binding protein